MNSYEYANSLLKLCPITYLSAEKQNCRVAYDELLFGRFNKK